MMPDKRPGRVSHAALAVVSLAATTATGVAHAETVTAARVDLSTSAGYSTNPFLSEDSNTDSAFIEGAIRPNISFIDDRGRTELGGYYSRSEYLRRSISASEAYGASARTNRKLSEKVDVRALLSYDSSIVGSADAEGNFDPSLPQYPDIGLIGQRQRREMFSATAGATIRPNARDVWTIDFDGSKVRYPGDALADANYKSYGARLGYSRAISETSTIGVTLGYTQIDYDAPNQDSRIISPQLTYSTRFAGGWSISAAVGVSLTRRDLIVGKDNSTALSGNLQACRETERSNLCFGGSRATSATGFGGARTQTDLFANYNYRLSERSTISARANYSINGDDGLVLPGNRKYLSVGTDYSHQFSERLRLTAAVAYRDAYAPFLSPDADIRGSIGLAYTLGSRR
ncbi:autotransporter domain-containing protein [Sphingomonas sp. KC8]|uniref:autotransporter domain-containing protein n=1 Tax=Sphingomonas sp. KC8 TaxID=1030157 RepID=UPI0002488A21|nr:autotransporter domain-containing protein [Sphingomonas sp. KC8]ARS27323.1 hypothetical protein KC8_08460 [Sphingomonas sp. KC8]